MSSEVQTRTEVKALIGIMTIVVYNLHSQKYIHEILTIHLGIDLIGGKINYYY
jgi:hypothetical protein